MRWGLLAGLGALLWPASGWAQLAPADAETCGRPDVVAAPELGATWAEAVQKLTGALAEGLAGQRCVSVRIVIAPSATPPGADVTVRLVDGREATRHARAPSSLLPIVLGVLATAPSPPVQAATAPGPDPHEVPDFSAPPPSHPQGEGGRVGLEVGFALGSRVGLPVPVVMSEVELFAQVVVSRWILLGSVRYVPIAWARGLTPDGDAYEEADIGLGFGHQFQRGRSELDVTVAPTLALISMETDLPVEVSGSLPDFRFNATLRYAYALGRTWQVRVALDSEVSPNALVHARVPAPGLVAIPAWTSGLRVGFAAQIL